MISLLTWWACAAPGGPVVLRGATVPGRGVSDIRVENGRITAVGTVDAGSAEVIDVSGRYIVPSFIDSHVHLAFLDATESLADNGVAGVVDWASPRSTLAVSSSVLQQRSSGPMITASGGYPTQTWGRDGYGAECSSLPTCIAELDANIAAGATVAKVPITGTAVLSEDVLRGVVDHAHERGLLVGTHALSDAQARLARTVGMDVLVHTPVEPLTDDTVAAWSTGIVITTLAAFGSRDTTVENLRRLRAAGTTVVYGTDLGNTRDARIQEAELRAMLESGMSGSAIVASGTTTPARVFNLQAAIEVGNAASFLVLRDNPTDNPLTLARPLEVWLSGSRR